MKGLIGLDYETFSDVDLRTRGVYNYVAGEKFHALMASIATEDGALTFDFIFDRVWSEGQPRETGAYQRFLKVLDSEHRVAAHNASFERVVTNHIVEHHDWSSFIDSAMLGRAMGAESKLEVASRQLTNNHKLEVGHALVMLFCVPNEFYPEGPTPELIEKHGHMDKWLQFIEYCEMDAQGSKAIVELAYQLLGEELVEREHAFEQATFLMNKNGWTVDLPLVNKMKVRAWANNIIAQRAFRKELGTDNSEEDTLELNFNSPKQLKEFCEHRGVQVKSLDKYHLPIVLNDVKTRIARNEAMLKEDSDEYPLIEKAITMLKEVEAMLETKMEIGGSTLSKLPVILDLSNEDSKLRDQYVHIGAGQTYRTTGRGVQMQNLKKLDGDIRDIETVYDFKEHWSNGDMAGQLRQVFTAGHPDGRLIVGDFSAVESRGLAYLAGEEWKLDAYREGLDVYKVLVTKYLGIEYDEVTDELRPRGKYSELSCGYQASASAVQEFMFRLGFSISTEDAQQNVTDWRAANPNIVELWYTLDDLLKNTVAMNETQEVLIGNGLRVRATPFILESMHNQHPGSVSLKIELLLQDGSPFVTRFIHGCYFRERTLCYYKPAERITEDNLWRATYRHPKTGRQTYYSIYGGKLSGILTQSFCRELFFESVHALRLELEAVDNAFICGQFHDEVNIDWRPGAHSLEEVEDIMREAMSRTRIQDFPLAVKVQSAYRYIK